MMQLEFWNEFKSYAEERKTKLKLRKAQPQHWYDMSYGSSNSHISLTVNTQTNQLGCEVYIPNSRETYEYFKLQKAEIETEIGNKLEWMDLPDKKASRIKIVSIGDIQIEENWTKYFEWMKSTAEIFQEVFGKYRNKLAVKLN